MVANLTCAKCGLPIERQPGPGRPASYCGDACKRLIEYELRRIDRRLGAYEIEQRELKARGVEAFDDDWRQQRLRALRKWIQTDQERLRELVGAGRGTHGSEENNQKDD